MTFSMLQKKLLDGGERGKLFFILNAFYFENVERKKWRQKDKCIINSSKDKVKNEHRKKVWIHPHIPVHFVSYRIQMAARVSM